MKHTIANLAPARRVLRHALSLTGSFALASQAGAVVIGYDIDNLGSTIAAGTASSTVYSIPFQLPGVGAYDLGPVSLLIRHAGSQSSSIYNLGITTDPEGTLNFSAPFNFSSSATFDGDQKVVFSPDVPYQLMGGTTYYLSFTGFDGSSRDLLKSSSTLSNGGTLVGPVTGLLAEDEGYGFHSKLVGSGGSGGSAVSGGSPLPAGSIGAFSITATAVPEAGTAISIMGGAAFLLGLGMRRRPRTADKA